MKKKTLALVAVTILAVAASVVVLADFGADNDNPQNMNVIRNLPPGGSCVCPQVWDPVVCKVQNPDGSTTWKYFSNACVAGCYGFTNCAHIAVQP